MLKKVYSNIKGVLASGEGEGIARCLPALAAACWRALKGKLRFWRELPQKRELQAALLLVAFLALALPVLAPLIRETLAAYREEKLLLRMVELPGAGLETVIVTGWLKMPAGVPGAGDSAALVEGAAARLRLEEAGRQRESWQNRYARGVKLAGQTADGRVFSLLGQVLDLPGGEKATYLMISTAAAEMNRARLSRREIGEALSGYGGGRVAVTCAGKINGELSPEELRAGAEGMMALAGAAVREKTVKDNLVSLTGLSPRLAGEISYAGREVNLNVALRSDPAERVTYVYVASPVIYTEY